MSGITYVHVSAKSPSNIFPILGGWNPNIFVIEEPMQNSPTQRVRLKIWNLLKTSLEQIPKTSLMFILVDSLMLKNKPDQVSLMCLCVGA